jgi:hypothetical protein
MTKKKQQSNFELVQECFTAYLERERNPKRHRTGVKRKGVGVPFPQYITQNIGYEMFPDGSVRPVRIDEGD